jgi:peptidyl-tRNA hydrolase, PTH1 family
VTLRRLLHHRAEAPHTEDDLFLVVGLGNPGERYARTRHNAGAMVADVLAERMGASWRTDRSRRNQVVDGRLGRPPQSRVVVARPRSFMNESGGPVAALLSYYKVPLHRLIVVHDELDLPSTVLRVKTDGGDGGHNGVRAVRTSIGSGDFIRVRVGIGRPTGRQDPADYVLSDFSRAERTELPGLLDRAADAVESVVAEGITKTQNVFNQ